MVPIPPRRTKMHTVWRYGMFWVLAAVSHSSSTSLQCPSWCWLGEKEGREKTISAHLCREKLSGFLQLGPRSFHLLIFSPIVVQMPPQTTGFPVAPSAFWVCESKPLAQSCFQSQTTHTVGRNHIKWWGTGTWQFCLYIRNTGFPGGSDGKESARNAGDPGSTSGLGRSPAEGNGNRLQYCCLENSIDRGAWRATVSPWGRKESDTTELLTLKHLRGINDNSL